MKIYDWFYEKGINKDIGTKIYLLFISIILVFLFCIFLMLHLPLLDMVEGQAEVAVRKILLIKAEEDGYATSLDENIYFSEGQPLYELIHSKGKNVYHAPYDGIVIEENITKKSSLYCKKGDVLLKIYDIKDLILRIPLSEKISSHLAGNAFIAFYRGKSFKSRIDGTILFEVQKEPLGYLYSKDIPKQAQPGEKIPVKIIKGNKRLYEYILQRGK